MDKSNTAESALDTTRKRQYERQRDLYGLSITFGLKSIFYKASALWNIQRNRLYEIDGYKSWTEFVESELRLSRMHANNFTSIGAGIAKRCPGYTEVSGFFIQKSDVDAMITDELAHSKIAMKEMRQLAAHDEGFSEFMQSVSTAKRSAEIESQFDLISNQVLTGNLKSKDASRGMEDKKRTKRDDRQMKIDEALKHLNAAAAHMMGMNVAKLSPTSKARRHMEYLIRIAHFYAVNPAYVDEYPTYEDALAIVAENEDHPELIPAIVSKSLAGA
jgi:hypothetical protein